MTCKDFYRKQIWCYGILSVLYALEYFELEEKYEEFEKIISAIKDIESKLGINLEKRINIKIVKETIDLHKKLSSNDVIEAYKRYGKELIKNVEIKNNGS